MENHSDEQLIIDYLNGDKEALEILIKRYLKPIYSFVYRYVDNGQEAEDITQEVFIKVWRNFKRFDRNKKFKTWIFHIAKNTSIDWLRKKKTIPFSEFENEKGENILAEKFADPAPLPDELFERADAGKMLKKALVQLSPKYRMVLFLRYNDHFTFREIAETLEESIDTIKTQHRRGIAILRKLLKEE